MRALVVYESMYGNTRHIAQAIAEGLRATIDAQAAPVSDAEFVGIHDIQLLVIGAPTHAWSLSRRRTRQAAADDLAKHSEQRIAPLAVATGVREWLRTVDVPGTCQIAVFDTRLDRPKLFTGSAVRRIQRHLHNAGVSVFGEPHSFRVSGTIGPLVFGEIERALAWGEDLGRAVVQSTTQHSPEKAASQ